MTNLDANLEYQINEKNKVSFQYQNISKIPDNLYNLHQSGYIGYNWANDFKNEKINAISVNADTQWASASLELRTLNDRLYFANSATIPVQVITPN